MIDCYHREACSFLNENGGAIDLGEKGGRSLLGGKGVEQVMVGMYCMREE